MCYNKANQSPCFKGLLHYNKSIFCDEKMNKKKLVKQNNSDNDNRCCDVFYSAITTYSRDEVTFIEWE